MISWIFRSLSMIWLGELCGIGSRAPAGRVLTGPAAEDQGVQQQRVLAPAGCRRVQETQATSLAAYSPGMEVRPSTSVLNAAHDVVLAGADVDRLAVMSYTGKSRPMLDDLPQGLSVRLRGTL